MILNKKKEGAQQTCCDQGTDLVSTSDYDLYVKTAIHLFQQNNPAQ